MIILTAELRKFFELILPLRIYLDGFLMSFIPFDGEASCLGILDELLSVFRLDRCQNGEKVFTITNSTLSILVREVLGHIGHLDALLVQVGDRYLIVLGWIAVDHLFGLQQLLLSFQDLLEKWRGHHAVWWHVVLPILITQSR